LFDIKLKKWENKPPGDSINHTIEKIKNGDSVLKERFINKYKPFIKKTISSTLGKYIDSEGSEEYSVGLIAFNEAIDNFDSKKNSNFFKYSNIVINHRIIDYIRKDRRTNNAIPFSYLENTDGFEEKYLVSDSHYQYDKIEVKEELLLLEKKLKKFNITLNDLVLNAPKHQDSRDMCIGIARVLAGKKNLYEKMLRKKRIPLTELMSLVDVNRKTVERNRKYIIAVSLVLQSGLEEIKEFFRDRGERGE
jgi:RNA polymerase sigma factor